MNRRPTLSLVSNRERNKKQALDVQAGKESEKGGSSGSAAKKSESDSELAYQEPIRPVRLVSEQEKRNREESNNWPDGKSILKGVVVLATFALSIYLLKRRFL